VKNGLDWRTLEAGATVEDGPFSRHLRHLLWVVEEKPLLLATLHQILHGQPCVDDRAAFRLLKAGLLKRVGQGYVCRCILYQRYFAEVL
jgi:hypothetical protein